MRRIFLASLLVLMIAIPTISMVLSPTITNYKDNKASTIKVFTEMSGVNAVIATNENINKALKAKATVNTSATLNLRLGWNPDCLNPLATSSGYDWKILDLIFDCLMVANPLNYTYPEYDIPLVLEEPPVFTVISENQAKWTLKLRKNITFFDGTPLTTEDLKFTLDFIEWLGEHNDPWYDIWRIYNGSEIIDNYTIDVYVDTIGIMDAYHILSAIVFPKHIYEVEETWGVSDDDSYDIFPNWNVTPEQVMAYEASSPNDPILTGYGPFMLEAWYPSNVSASQATTFVLRRNPNYYLRAINEHGNIVVPWRPLESDYVDLHGPYIETVIYNVIKDDNEAVKAILNGTIDLLEDMDLYQNISQLEEAGFNITTALRLGFGHVLINTESSKPSANNTALLNASEFRRALAYAINKTRICEETWDGWAEPLDTLLPRNYGLWSPAYTGELPGDYYRQYKDLALQELAKLGIDDYDNDSWLEWNSSDPNSEINITIEATDAPSIRNTIGIVAESIEDIGIHATQRYVDFNTLLNDLFSGNFQLAFFGFGLDRIPYHMENFASWGIFSLLSGWENRTYDDLISQAFYRESNWSAIYGLVRRAAAIFWYELPMIPLYSNIIVGAYDPSWIGIISIPNSPADNWYTIRRIAQFIPGISIVSPGYGSYISSSGVNVELNVLCIGISNVSLFVNDSLVVVWYPNNISESVSYPLIFDSEGCYNISARAYYANGKVSGDSVLVYVDWSEPLIAVVSPANGSLVSGNINITLNVSDNFAVNFVEFIVPGYYYDSINVNNKQAVVSHNMTTTEFSDGYIDVYICVYDEAGNTNSTVLRLLVDNTPPSLRIVSPNNNSYVTTDTITINWEGTDANGISYYNASLDGSPWEQLPADQNSITYTSLTAGKHIFKLIAVDAVGLIREASLIFYVDLSPPSISITSPSNGSTFNVHEVNVSWSATDDVCVDYFEIYVNGSLYAMLPSNATGTKLVLGNDTYAIRVVAYDYAGRTSYDEVTVTINVDLWVTIEGYANNSYVSSSSLTIDINYGNSTKVDKLVLYVDGSIVALWNSTNISASPISHTLSLAEGRRAIEVVINDTLGTKVVYKLIITVDTSIPAVSLNVPMYASGCVNIEYSANDENPITSVVLKINDSTIDSRSSAGTYVYLWYTDLWSDGVYNVTVIATDIAGNSHYAYSIVYVDNSAPKVDTAEPADGYITNRTVLDIHVVASDNISSIFQVKIYVENELVLNMSYDAESIDEILSVSLPDTQGEVPIAVIVINKVGLEAKASFTVVVDLSMPDVWVNVANGTYLASGTLALEWISEDSISGIKSLYIKLDDGDWTACNASGEINLENMTEGQHIFYIKVEDNAGNAIIRKFVFVVDLSSPYLVYSNIPSNGTYNSITTLLMNITANDTISEVSYIKVTVEGPSSTETFDVYNFKALINVSFDVVGEYMIRIVMYDIAGNMASYTYKFVVDYLAPEVSFLNINDLVADLLEFNFSVADNYFDRVIVYANDSIIAEFNFTANIYNVSYRITENLYGILIIKIIAYDLANNYRIISTTVRVDTICPTLSILGPENMSYTSSPEVTWNVSDVGSGVDHIEVYVNGTLVASLSPENTSYTLNVSDGAYIVAIRAYDKAGNIGESSVLIYLDTTPPTIMITSPANGTVIRETTVNVSWSAQDNFGIKCFLVIVGNNVYNMTATYVILNLTEGVHTIVVRAYDYAGNYAEDSITITVETKHPQFIPNIIAVAIVVAIIIVTIVAILLRRKRIEPTEESSLVL